jgi:hypothetical protein
LINNDFLEIHSILRRRKAEKYWLLGSRIAAFTAIHASIADGREHRKREVRLS